MQNIKEKSLANLRMLGLDPIVKNKTGHPGMVLSAAPLMHELYLNHISSNVNDIHWINRDRFVLSAGHGSSLLYAQLHLAGFDVSIDDIKDLRKLGSKTPGHPEINVTPGVDVSTGPLGQGFATAVGLALNEKHLSAKYNKQNLKLFNHYTYVICGDGDLQEGVCQESIQLAGVFGLSKLIVLYDSNDSQLDSLVNKVQRVDYKGWFESNQWEYILVKNGNDLNEIDQAIEKAKLSNKPTLIECKTIIGLGHPKQGTPKMHSDPFTESEMEIVKKYHSWIEEPFTVLKDVKQLWIDTFNNRSLKKYNEWQNIAKEYKKLYPTNWNELFNKKEITINDFKELIHQENEATRVSSGKVLKKLQELDKTLFGGSADLASPTKVQGYFGDFSNLTPTGNNILFGIREFAMGDIVNGISLYGCSKAFAGTYLVFSDYMKNAMRMAAMQETSALYILTHDTIGVGYDGPTHQPVEQIVGFRATPNMITFRPADIKETIGAYVYGYNQHKTPSVFLFSRQDTPQYTETSSDKVVMGGYKVISENLTKPLDAIIIATGSELQYGIKYAKNSNKNIRVISMPSTNLFDKQTNEYKESIIPKNFEKIISIEASNELSWYKYVGKKGLVISINEFGASGFADDVLAKYGFSQDKINCKIDNYLKNYRKENYEN